LGSNSLRLLIARLDAGEIIAVRRELLETRLGEKLIPGGKLFPEAKRRTLEGIKSLLAIMQQEKVGKGAVIATSAAREACDGFDFLQQISEISLFPVRLLSPQEEAYYGFMGARRALKGRGLEEETMLVLDLGGRSSEVSWVEKGAFCYHSFAFGAVSLQERLENNAALSEVRQEKLQGFLGAKMEEEIGKSSPSLLRKKSLVGLGGTIATLAALEQGLDYYQAGAVHGFVLQKKSVERWKNKFAEITRQEIKSLLPFAPQRADIMAAGTTALFSFMEYLQKDNLVVSEEGLLWGFLQSLLII